LADGALRAEGQFLPSVLCTAAMSVALRGASASVIPIEFSES
jgi:hypothetical protein